MTKLFVSSIVISACIFIYANAGPIGELGVTEDAKQIADRIKDYDEDRPCTKEAVDEMRKCPDTNWLIELFEKMITKTDSGEYIIIDGTIGNDPFQIKVPAHPKNNTEQLSSKHEPTPHSLELWKL